VTVISPAQLAAMAMRQTTAMPESGTIIHTVTTQNAIGGVTTSHQDGPTVRYRSTVPNRVSGGAEPAITDRLGSRVLHHYSFPVGTVLSHTDRFRRADGRVLEVLSVEQHSYLTAIRAYLAELG
jgi:hypothetical protein